MEVRGEAMELAAHWIEARRRGVVGIDTGGDRCSLELGLGLTRSRGRRRDEDEKPPKLASG